MRLVDFLDKGASLHPSGAPCLMMSGLPDGIVGARAYHRHRARLRVVTRAAARLSHPAGGDDRRSWRAG